MHGRGNCFFVAAGILLFSISMNVKGKEMEAKRRKEKGYIDIFNVEKTTLIFYRIRTIFFICIEK